MFARRLEGFTFTVAQRWPWKSQEAVKKAIKQI